MAFLGLPSVLSFSTDMSLDRPSWCVPHQTPLKVPLCEAVCAVLTALVTRDSRRLHVRSYYPCPQRSAQACSMTLMWRLRQSAHADQDMLLLETIKPYVPDEIKEQDALEMLDGLGYIVDVDVEKADVGQVAQTRMETEVRSADMKVEALRKIMSLVQDRADSELVF